MQLFEEQLERKVIFEGKILEVYLDQVRLPNGDCASREVVCHPGGVAILPLSQDNMVTLVRQYRYPVGAVLLELPAGKLDKGEKPAAAALRELGEETGLHAKKLTALGSMLASPGFCNEEIHLYLARELTQHQSHPDQDEFLDVLTMPFAQLVQMVLEGGVTDGKTVAAVLKTKVLLGL